MDNVILVDVFDTPVGTGEKAAVHQKGLLHRAFSVFIYSGDEMLLQQRAQHKYHSGGLWSNACCSHPRHGEGLVQAAQRRLYEELGVRAGSFAEIFSFVYFHKFNSTLFEYEYDHVFSCEYSGDIQANPEEIMAVQWIAFKDLAADLKDNPQRYSPWFLTACPQVLAALQK